MAQRQRVDVSSLERGEHVWLRMTDGSKAYVSVVGRSVENDVVWLSFQDGEGFVYEAREVNGQFVYANGVEDLQVVVAFQSS